MFNCKAASRLLSQANDRRLTFGERLRLKFHLLICRSCRHFSADWKRFGTALRAYARNADTGTTLVQIALPAEARQRILRVLQKGTS